MSIATQFYVDKATVIYKITEQRATHDILLMYAYAFVCAKNAEVSYSCDCGLFDIQNFTEICMWCHSIEKF